MPDNLPELRDIHIPQDISNFPLGYGWLVILGILLGSFILYKITRLAVVKSRKIYTLRLVKNIPLANVQKSASKISEILRRVCVYKYPEATVLSGNDWIDFVNSKSKTKLNDKIAGLLVNAPYMPKNSTTYSIDDLAKLKIFCSKWIGENL
ncbi:MAG: DUF4381 domain-containing protein [Alphaproteobacteria bacterium]|nr:DUF4381 domain-containing protein [Alphaproteobacteria bacterium]